MLFSEKTIKDVVRIIIKDIINNPNLLEDRNMDYHGNIILNDIILTIFYHDLENSKKSDLFNKEKILNFLNKCPMNIDNFNISLDNNHWLNCFADVERDGYCLNISFNLNSKQINRYLRKKKIESLI